MKPKYIKSSNLPPRGIILTPLIYWMLLDHFDSPVWAYGVVLTLVGINMIVDMHRLFFGESVDVLEKKKE